MELRAQRAMPPTLRFPATQDDSNQSQPTSLTKQLTVIASKRTLPVMELRGKQLFRRCRAVNVLHFTVVFTALSVIHLSPYLDVTL